MDRIARFTPSFKDTFFVDKTDAQFIMSNRDIIRLYEGIKTNIENTHSLKWEDYCEEIFSE